MSRFVPPEIDQLMWSIAESGNADAVAEFHARYPAYAQELNQRANMVHSLRAGKGSGAPRELPAFRLRPAPARPIWPVALACSAALAVAIGGFAYSLSLPVAVLSPAPKVTMQPIEPAVRYVTPAPSSSAQSEPRPFTQNAPSPAPPKPTRAADTPTQIVVAQADLSSAIQLIAAQGGLRADLAPGMPNPIVNVRMDGVTPLQALEQLGLDYAFRVFDQYDGSVLVIPLQPETLPGEKTDPTILQED
jgi:hypothetical protein